MQPTADDLFESKLSREGLQVREVPRHATTVESFRLATGPRLFPYTTGAAPQVTERPEKWVGRSATD